MRQLLAAIAALAGAFRTVYEWCGKTGRMVGRVISTPLFGGGAVPAAMADDESPVAMVAAGAETDTLQNIRRLAGAFAADRVTGEDLADVADNRIEWLAAMDRPMLARLLCSDDQALRAHLRGTKSIRGVLAADSESVAEYNRAMAIRPDDDEPEAQPVYGMAA